MSALAHLEPLPLARRAPPLPAAEDARVARLRRALQVALGLVWLLDAALQCQPFMFGRGFASTVIVPAANGNPPLVARSELWAAHVIAATPVVWNAFFATVQLALALGLFRRRTVKLALAGTVAWSLGVWWFGEGLGGILAGASPFAGAPGPVVLYALLALLLWPADGAGDSVASAGISRRGAVSAWVVLWASETYFALLPANRSGSALHDALGIAFALTALAAVVPARLARPVLAFGLIVAAVLWVVGQDLGGILTGQSTDPGSGPLLALLVVAYWPLRRARSACRNGEA